ncbi:hypothetical protein [Amycolatopsis sp. cg9]|uniref:hypothetical protein n=1 Tax=Amycolatopsis sp. cg9 TaxID=3238801 RepID=UPI00352625D5
MNRSGKRAAVVGAVAAGALALAAPGALATEQGGTSKTCPDSGFCRTDPVWFPGGTLSVDADVHGSGPAEWIVHGQNGVVCRTGFAAEAPPSSWVCFNVPAQTLEANVGGPAGPSNIGLRW